MDETEATLSLMGTSKTSTRMRLMLLELYLCKFDQMPSDLIILICFNEKGFPYDASAPLEHVSGGG